jgi:hypothetical protein
MIPGICKESADFNHFRTQRWQQAGSVMDPGPGGQTWFFWFLVAVASLHPGNPRGRSASIGKLGEGRDPWKRRVGSFFPSKNEKNEPARIPVC